MTGEVLGSPGRLAVFGAYSDHDHYQRNRVLVALMRDLAQDSVLLRPAEAVGDHGFSAGSSLVARLRRIGSDLLSLWRHRRSLDNCDTVFVPYPAYLEILLLLVSGRRRGRRLIVDAFLELHSTVVEDRRRFRPGSPGAALVLWFQRFTLRRADLVLIDTPVQARLLRERLGREAPRVLSVPVGIDERIWQPLPPGGDRGRLRVLFWGTFIPLHGIETIVGAAGLLAAQALPVEFHLVGDGQTADAIAELLQNLNPGNVQWRRERVESAELVHAAQQADVVLGVFGASAKAGAVIPYKVQQGLALNLPVITREAEDLAAEPAAGLVTVPPQDPDALAAALAELLRQRAQGWEPRTREIYDLHFSNAVIRRTLAEALVP